MLSGGWKRSCNCRTAPSPSGRWELRKVPRYRPCWLIFSCITRLTRGWPGPTRPSRSSATAMTRWCTAAARPRPNGLALSDHVRAEQVKLDFPGDVGDAGLAGLAGGEVAGFLGLAGAGPVRAVPDE